MDYDMMHILISMQVYAYYIVFCYIMRYPQPHLKRSVDLFHRFHAVSL